MRISTLALIAATYSYAWVAASPAPSASVMEDKIMCRIAGYGWGDSAMINNPVFSEIDNLDNGSVPVAPQPGGGFCNRAFCEGDSNDHCNTAVYVCNDNGHEIWVPVGAVHGYVQAVLDSRAGGCVENYDPPLVWGQAFDYEGGFNVIAGMQYGTRC